jgi:Cof subfamily protein (haloacid dehalogenase superfamily)
MEFALMTSRKISLVLADVDGTLLTEDKVLTDRAREAVHGLRSAGIRFAITSGRPPRGMAMLLEPLQLDTPIAGFNGGVFVDRHLSVIEQKTLSTEAAEEAIDLIHRHRLDAWIYRGGEWLITNAHAPHVSREAWTVKFAPTVVRTLDGALTDVAKIVGVSNDLAAVAQCEAAAQTALGKRGSAHRSQPYYIDITHPDAHKGAVVEYLSAHLAIPKTEIATIGDQPNDILMFERSGFSIAMGNASSDVRASAKATTDSCDDEGFAKAMERFVLADAVEARA